MHELYCQGERADKLHRTLEGFDVFGYGLEWALICIVGLSSSDAKSFVSTSNQP